MLNFITLEFTSSTVKIEFLLNVKVEYVCIFSYNFKVKEEKRLKH